MVSRRWISWFRLTEEQLAAPARPRPARLRVEALEDRCVPTTFTVTLGTDSAAGVSTGVNAGDLRYCIAQANAHGSGADNIVFAPSVASVSLTHGPLTISDPRLLTIQGPASNLTISGNNSFTIFQVDEGSNVTFNNLHITKGESTTGGGGINNSGKVVLYDCTLDYNSGVRGGGLQNLGTAALYDSTFDHNSATINGGAVSSDKGMLALTDCTLAFNTSGSVGEALSTGETTTLINCTIVDNSALNQGGGIFSNLVLNLTNNIVAQNTAALGPDIFNGPVATIGVASHNLIGIDGITKNLFGPLSNGSNGNQVGTSSNPINPLLGPLQNNGGPTLTMAPLANSSAIDAGDDSVAASVPIDQRGLPRLSGGHVDIGAFETQVSTPPPPVLHQGRRYGT